MENTIWKIARQMIEANTLPLLSFYIPVLELAYWRRSLDKDENCGGAQEDGEQDKRYVVFIKAVINSVGCIRNGKGGCTRSYTSQS